MNRDGKIRWFLAGVFSAVIVFTLVYFALIAPIERNIQATVDKIVEQRDAALTENAKLRSQLAIMDRQHNFTLSFPSPVTQ